MHPTLATAQRLCASGKAQEALDICRRMLEHNPNDILVWALIADIAVAHDEMPLAIEALKRLSKLDPHNHSVFNNLGSALGRAGQTKEAAQALSVAAQLKPSHAETHSNLSTALCDLGDYDGAVIAARQAIALNPNWSIPHVHLANPLVELENSDEANRAYQRAIELDPDNATAHKNYGLNLLRIGDLRQGLAEYEWRWQADNMETPVKRFGQPIWSGKQFDRRILVYGEQGLGDQIQFMRYARFLKNRGSYVILQVSDCLRELIQPESLYDELLGLSDCPMGFDDHCPLMSIPFVLGWQQHSIPATSNCFDPPPLYRDRWRANIERQKGYRIGIAWEGNIKTQAGRSRAIPLEAFAPLAEIPEVQLVNLQKGPSVAHQISTCGFSNRIVDWTPEMDRGPAAFVDTAAVLKQLDLVVTCDTAVAHLSAAMGIPTWILLRRVADWRWFSNRLDSPWYRTVRLFRQSEDRSWFTLIRTVAETVAEMRKSRP